MKKETYNRILTLYMTGLEEQLDNELCRLSDIELKHLSELTAQEHPQLAKIANYLLTEV